MTDNERYTKFLGFATLLQQEIWNTELSIVPMMTGGYPTSQVAKELAEALQTLIAQRAYDLGYHILVQQLYTDHYSYPEAAAREALRDEITDLTQWPESPDSE